MTIHHGHATFINPFLVAINWVNLSARMSHEKSVRLQVKTYSKVNAKKTVKEKKQSYEKKSSC